MKEDLKKDLRNFFKIILIFLIGVISLFMVGPIINHFSDESAGIRWCERNQPEFNLTAIPFEEEVKYLNKTIDCFNKYWGLWNYTGPSLEVQNKYGPYYTTTVTSPTTTIGFYFDRPEFKDCMNDCLTNFPNTTSTYGNYTEVTYNNADLRFCDHACYKIIEGSD